MNEIKTGGPAFPISLPGLGDNGASGATLRDYFAAKAMQAIVSRVVEADGSMTANAIACATNGAYFIADEMLIVREAQ